MATTSTRGTGSHTLFRQHKQMTRQGCATGDVETNPCHMTGTVKHVAARLLHHRRMRPAASNLMHDSLNHELPPRAKSPLTRQNTAGCCMWTLNKPYNLTLKLDTCVCVRACMRACVRGYLGEGTRFEIHDHQCMWSSMIAAVRLPCFGPNHHTVRTPKHAHSTI